MQAAISHDPRTDRTVKRNRSRASWSIVLAGGEDGQNPGADYVQVGARRPSQYRCFEGQETLLEQTVASATALSGSERVITLIGAGHGKHLDAEQIYLPGVVIEQPRQRGTASAIMTCVAYAMAHDPEAVVTIFPSDQFVASRERFLAYVEESVDAAVQHPHHIIGLGAMPTFAEVEYGWLKPGEPTGDGTAGNCLHVESFREKPSRAEAEQLFATGALWNTFIFSATADVLWETAWAAFPLLMERLDPIKTLFAEREPGRTVDDSLAQAFTNLPSLDMARGLLQTFYPQLLVIPMKGVQWSDWGRPRRVAEATPSTAPSSTVTELPSIGRADS